MSTVLSEHEVLTVSDRSTSGIPADVEAGLFVKADGTICGAGDAAFGISAYDALLGQELAIHKIGIFKVQAAGAVAIGDDLTSDGSGKAVAMTAVSVTVPAGATPVTSDAAQPTLVLAGGALPLAKNGRAVTACSAGGWILASIPG